MDAAQLASLESIRVYTIGVGTVGKAKSPVRKRPDGSFIYDWVEVNIDEGTLQSIAQETGGRYFRATSGDKLREVYEEIDTLEKTRFNVFRYNKRTEEFPLLGWLTLMVIGAEAFIRHVFLRSLP
jgi:Ca-activated chloride channel family protein